MPQLPSFLCRLGGHDWKHAVGISKKAFSVLRNIKGRCSGFLPPHAFRLVRVDMMPGGAAAILQPESNKHGDKEDTLKKPKRKSLWHH